MPLAFSEEKSSLHTGVWEVTEKEIFFLEELHLYPEEEKELDQLSERKRMQWLSSRFLLHRLTNEENRLITMKDDMGKPYLEDSPLFISLSHSHDLAAAMVAGFPCGIDIQHRVEKLMRIRTKFISEREKEALPGYDDLDFVHAYWGAKECLFKAYGRGQVDFRKHLFLDVVDINEQTIKGIIDKDEYYMEYLLRYHLVGNSMLVYTVEMGQW